MGTNLMYRAALAGDVPLMLTIIHDDPTSFYPVQFTSLGDTIAHIAALLGHTDFIKEIVFRNPLLAREVNQQGYSPLHLASDKGQVGVVEELLRAGNDLCLVRDKDGKLPVHVAAKAGKLNVLKKLMEVDPDCLERLTARGETLLHLAVKANQMQVIQFLAETPNYSELINMKDDKGDTALHFAAAMRSKEMTRFLLRSEGIEVNAENKKGETPLGVILSLFPQNGGAAEEVNDIIRTAGGLPTNPRSVVDIGVAASATSPPPPATQETEESDGQWLKDMRKSLMVVAALIATITFEAGLSKRDDDNIKDSAAASAPSMYYDGRSSSYYDYYLDNKYIAFRLFDMISLFSSLTVILLLLTKFSVKKKYLVIFLSKIMHLSIFSVGSAFLLLSWANNADNNTEIFIIGSFWIGWLYLTCYAVVSRLASSAGFFVGRLGLKRFVTPKNKYLAFFLKGLRVVLSLLFALVLFYVLFILTRYNISQLI